MERAVRQSTDPKAVGPTERCPRPFTEFADPRPDATAQRRLAAAIHDGPKMVAQRRWSEALATSQRVVAEPTRQSGHATVRQPVIQREIDAVKLAKFIEDVVAAIRKEDYRAAYLLLTNHDRVASMNLTLSSKMTLFDPKGRPNYSDNMFFTKTDRVLIATVADPKRDILAAENQEKVFGKENAGYWRPLVMGNLEEFMHAYQKASGGFLSSSTQEFQKTLSAEQQKSMSFNEIDILAQMEDWGMAPKDSGFVEAHPDSRGPYWEWRTGEKYTPTVLEDDPFKDF